MEKLKNANADFALLPLRYLNNLPYPNLLYKNLVHVYYLQADPDGNYQIFNVIIVFCF